MYVYVLGLSPYFMAFHKKSKLRTELKFDSRKELYGNFALPRPRKLAALENAFFHFLSHFGTGFLDVGQN